MTNKENKLKTEIKVDYRIIDELFDVCPFCGEKPNVFQVPEKRYGKDAPFGWVVDCKNMGCIFQMSIPDQSFKHLMKDWNERV